MPKVSPVANVPASTPVPAYNVRRSFASYSTRGSLEFAEGLATHVIELMPALSKMRLLRQWSGLCDMTPDFSPIMGGTPVGGFYVDVGWGTYGFKAGPVSGEAMAECIATGRTPEIIASFGLDRFGDGCQHVENDLRLGNRYSCFREMLRSRHYCFVFQK